MRIIGHLKKSFLVLLIFSKMQLQSKISVFSIWPREWTYYLLCVLTIFFSKLIKYRQFKSKFCQELPEIWIELSPSRLKDLFPSQSIVVNWTVKHRSQINSIIPSSKVRVKVKIKILYICSQSSSSLYFSKIIYVSSTQ